MAVKVLIQVHTPTSTTQYECSGDLELYLTEMIRLLNYLHPKMHKITIVIE